MSAIRESEMGFGGSDSLNSTNEIISKYEKKLNQSISNKVLKNSNTGVPIVLTKEETSYLNKQAESEKVEVEVPSPTITLKKGSTEIKIPRAADMVHRMAKLYPKESDSTKDIGDGLVGAQLPAELIENKRSIVTGETVKTVNQNAYEIRLEILKSAIQFLQWQTATKIEIDTKNKMTSDCSSLSIKSDDAIDLASKFYKFVENKR